MNPVWLGYTGWSTEATGSACEPGELRHMDGSGNLAETFKRNAYRGDVCQGCGIEVAPGEDGRKVVSIKDTLAGQMVAALKGDPGYRVWCLNCEPMSAIELGSVILNSLLSR